MSKRRMLGAAGLGLALAVSTPVVAQTAWEPTKPVTFLIPAGSGGGADQMARFIQGIISKNNLMKQPLIVVNKGGGAGAEAFIEMKNAKDDPHKIVITLSNLFTTPLATGVPFNWKDLTPVAMLSLCLLYTSDDHGRVQLVDALPGEAHAIENARTEILD